MKTRFFIAVMSLVLGGVATTQAQTQTASIGITGRVLPAYRIEPLSVQSPARTVRAESVTASQLQVFFSGGEEVQHAVLLVTLRTNAASYRVFATPLTSEATVEIGADAARLSGNGSKVSPAALTGFAPVPRFTLDQPQILARGTRISMGGRFTDPDNAIVVEIRISIPPQKSGSLIVSMGD